MARRCSAALAAALLAACGGGDGGGTPAGTGVVDAAGGEVVYGAPMEKAETVAIADLVPRSKELDGRPVRVEGVVTDVCAKRGCWIEICEPQGPAKVTFKVEDGAIVFPLSARGRRAVADGTLRRVELTLEKTREHLARRAAESGEPFDPASVEEPLVMVRLDGAGARLSDSR